MHRRRGPGKHFDVTGHASPNVPRPEYLVLGFNLQPYLPQALRNLPLSLLCVAVVSEVFMASTARGSGPRLCHLSIFLQLHKSMHPVAM